MKVLEIADEANILVNKVWSNRAPIFYIKQENGSYNRNLMKTDGMKGQGKYISIYQGNWKSYIPDKIFCS